MGHDSQVVVVVDDDAAVRHALKFALESEGLKIRVHGHGRALLADPELKRYACLVIDYRMPDIDGLELVDMLRSRGTMAPIIMTPVVPMSACANAPLAPESARFSRSRWPPARSARPSMPRSPRRPPHLRRIP